MIESLIATKRILVMVGSGGVGKTTTSAALGLLAATQGKNTVVITVDPAKRLATSLGTDLSDQPSDLTTEVRKYLPDARGFAAVVPDTRATFVSLVRNLAPTPEVAERLIANPIFEILAREFSGANEYMALNRLATLARDSKWDTLVLDTPPSKNVIALLKAPELLAELFEEKILRLIASPSRFLAAGVEKALELLQMITGAGFVRHLHDFVVALDAMRENFTKSVSDLRDLLKSDSIAYLGVASPQTSSLDELKALEEALETHGRPLSGMVINRSIADLKFSPNTPAHLEQAVAWVKQLANNEAKFSESLAAPTVLRFTEFPKDVHGLSDLCQMVSSRIK